MGDLNISRAAIALDDHPARQLAVEWADHLRRDRRRSDHTVRAYLATAHRLIGFIGRHRGGPVDGAVLAALDRGDLRAYLAERRGEGLANVSTALKRRSMVEACGSILRAISSEANGMLTATEQ